MSPLRSTGRACLALSAWFCAGLGGCSENASDSAASADAGAGGSRSGSGGGQVSGGTAPVAGSGGVTGGFGAAAGTDPQVAGSGPGGAAGARPTTGGGGGSAGGEPDRVLPEDTVLLQPEVQGQILAPITGYEMSNRCPMADYANCELPIYSSYDRDTDEWWDILVEELLFSRVPVVLMHGRGCFDPIAGTSGNGNMCPRLLTHLVDAIERAGAGDVIRLGMWDDTGAYQGTRNNVDGLPGDTLFDVSDQSSWRFFWDHNLRVWFDTVPSSLWFRIEGHPLVAFWTLGSALFSNQEGNASALLRHLKTEFEARYGETPLFILDQAWIGVDSTITPAEAWGVNSWFVPPNDNWYTYTEWDGAWWGATVPAFRLPNTLPGCGDACWEIGRRDGAALREALDAGADATVTLLEGWTDIFEAAGYYRSAEWSFPNQYIGIVREYADPNMPTLRLQAEAADTLSSQTSDHDEGFVYRVDVPNIGRLSDDTGWHVDWTTGGGWLEYEAVALVCGTYRFTARVSATAEQTLHLEVDGTSLGTQSVTPSDDPSGYSLVHLGSIEVETGAHRFRLVSDDGGVSVDWFFLRRSQECP